MGTTNYGNQDIKFDYKEPGKSENFNKLNYKVLPTGIYDGGTLTKVDATTVQVATLTAIIEDSTNEVSVKFNTTSTVNITVAPTTPYIILRFSWSNVENNYVDFLAVAYASIVTTDLIVGKAEYDGSNVLQSTFDTTRKSTSIIKQLEDKQNNLKVVSKEPFSNVVTVKAGLAAIGGAYFDISESDTGTISDTTAGRIDLIYIDNSGVIQVEEGVDNASPTAPSFPANSLVLAKITRGASRTDIRGSDISNYEVDKSV